MVAEKCRHRELREQAAPALEHAGDCGVLSQPAKRADVLGLKLFLDDGSVEMGSNIVERAIRLNCDRLVIVQLLFLSTCRH